MQPGTDIITSTFIIIITTNITVNVNGKRDLEGSSWGHGRWMALKSVRATRARPQAPLSATRRSFPAAQLLIFNLIAIHLLTFPLAITFSFFISLCMSFWSPHDFVSFRKRIFFGKIEEHDRIAIFSFNKLFWISVLIPFKSSSYV